MVLNLFKRKSCPKSPTRICLKKIGPLSNMIMLSITRISSGENKTRANNEIMISNIHFKMVLKSSPMYNLVGAKS